MRVFHHDLYRQWPEYDRPRTWILIWGRASLQVPDDTLVFYWTRGDKGGPRYPVVL